MTDPMTALVRRAARHSDDEIAALTGSAAEADLMARILAEAPPAGPAVDLGALAPAGGTPASRPGRARRPVSRRRRVIAMAAVAATVAASTTTLVVAQRGGESGEPQWAAETLALADATPRLLVHAPGWQLESTDQFEESSGSMTFTDGGDGLLYLEWNQPGDLARTIADRTSTATGSAPATVAGQEAMSFSWPGDEHGAIWQQGDAVVVLMAYRAPMDDGEWAQVLASVEQVDAETWLSALPVDVVQPSELDSVIDELLTGITLPAGTQIATPAGAVTRYQLVHKVERTARCSWIDAWWAATEAGDTAAAAAATTVLAGARDWPIQDEIPYHADDAYWEPVESIVRGELPGSRTIVIEGDTPVEQWRTLIDC